MTVNMGTVDRVVRGAVGLILLALAFFSDMALFDTAWVKWVAVLIGIVMLATAATRFCPAYTLFGIKTCKS